MSNVDTQTIARHGRGTGRGQNDSGPPAAWPEVVTQLRTGSAMSWLSVRGRDGGVHTRPVFAAWGETSFFFATKASAVKTTHLKADGRVSLAVDLGTTHLVVEGIASRLTNEDDLHRVTVAMKDVFEWPVEARGQELDAPYAAPTSGGPPFEAWELVPTRALAFPTEDQFEPTRFVFPVGNP